MFNSDTNSNVYAVDETTKLQHTILEQQSEKAKDLVLRTFMRMCEPEQTNFWERSPMSVSCSEPLPENLEKFANEHRAEFQEWLKKQSTILHTDVD